MKVLFLNEYERNKEIELTNFDIESCEKWIKENINHGDVVDINDIDKSEFEEDGIFEDFEEGGGCEEVNRGMCVLIGSKLDVKLNVISVVCSKFCMENGWFEMVSNFVIKKDD